MPVIRRVHCKWYEWTIARNSLTTQNGLVMMAALIFAISLGALIQFGVFSWRAAMLSVAAMPLSTQTSEILTTCSTSSESPDFECATQWLQLSANLSGEDRRMWPVRLYFAALRAVGVVTPAKAGWLQREMGTCARFIAVVADERMQRNRLCIAEVQSF